VRSAGLAGCLARLPAGPGPERLPGELGRIDIQDRIHFCLISNPMYVTARRPGLGRPCPPWRLDQLLLRQLPRLPDAAEIGRKKLAQSHVPIQQPVV
jgi:hypothetical protein